jgi:hypothetical protein
MFDLDEEIAEQIVSKFAAGFLCCCTFGGRARRPRLREPIVVKACHANASFPLVQNSTGRNWREVEKDGRKPP